MGRPPIALGDAQRLEVETLAALLSQDQIADYFGIARNTFLAICQRDPEVLERYKRGKAKAIAHVANGLLMKARSGDTTSAIFYLKTQAGWRETAAVEHTVGETDDRAETAFQIVAARLERLRRRHAPGLDGSAERPPLLEAGQ